MTKEDVAEWLKALAQDGIHLKAIPDHYRIVMECTGRSFGPMVALRWIMEHHKWDLYSYLTLYGGPAVPTLEQDIELLLDGLRERYITVTTDGEDIRWYPADAKISNYELNGLRRYREHLIPLLAAPSFIHARNVSGALRAQIVRFHDFTCQYCRRVGTPELDPDQHAWHVDHVRPLTLGGSNDPSNLTLACLRCNLMKGSKDLDQFLQQVTGSL